MDLISLDKIDSCGTNLKADIFQYVDQECINCGDTKSA